MNFTLTDSSFSLRNVNDNDTSLLLAIYSSTREQEMQMLSDWSDVQKNAFVLQQFNAQHTYYKEHYPDIHFYIIERNGEALGRLYLDVTKRHKSIHIIDITLLPVGRNKGTGTSILKDILNYANSLQKSVTIHVESFNPALNLYKRLGFQMIDKTNEVYYLMEHSVMDMASHKIAV